MQFFEDMDQNARWCRGAAGYIETFQSSDRFDLAATWQAVLDDNDGHDIVHGVLRVGTPVSSHMLDGLPGGCSGACMMHHAFT